MILSAVDLPQPEGPSSEMKSPWLHLQVHVAQRDHVAIEHLVHMAESQKRRALPERQDIVVANGHDASAG
jgi:hypothetical protein